MILTITPNPSLDLLFEAERLVWDDANRIEEPRRRPGGQGINLSRAARVMGIPTHALALLGGDTGDEIARVLTAEGMPLTAVRIAATTRTFVGVRELATGRSLLLNARGPVLSQTEREALIDAVETTCAAVKPDWVACCGSVPRGIGDDVYAQIGAIAKHCGARFVADCDGDALRAAEPLCDLLAPNRHEAERLTGRTIDSVDAAAHAVLELARRRIAAITLDADGAVLSDGTSVWLGKPTLPIPGGNTVGAGDAFLAGLLGGLEASAYLGALAAAVTAGTAVLHSGGDHMVTLAAIAEVSKTIEVRQLV